jgi:hypothetical protein
MFARNRLGLLLSVLATGTFGCMAVPDPDFAALESALVLRIGQAKRDEAGGAIDFTFELRNRGRESVSACLGMSRRVSYEANSRGGTSGTFVDHPGCVREFEIPPSGVMSWDENLKVSGLPRGPVEVEVTIEIVNPRRCQGGVGCTTLDVKSNQVQIRHSRKRRSSSGRHSSTWPSRQAPSRWGDHILRVRCPAGTTSFSAEARGKSPKLYIVSVGRMADLRGNHQAVHEEPPSRRMAVERASRLSRLCLAQALRTG